MSIIFGKHDGCDREFIWEVPEDIAPYISKNDLLLVDTYRGLDIATASSNVISGEGAIDVAEKNGAYFPLKKVISFANQAMQNYIKRSLKERVLKRIQQMDVEQSISGELPF